MAWLSGYTYRKKCAVVATVAGAQTNYPLELIVGESSGAAGVDVDCENHCITFPNDLRCTKEDGTTKHDYWIDPTSLEGTAPNRKVTVTIEVASIPASGYVDFWIYYGKLGDSGESNGSDTFDFFDDFLGTGQGYDSMFDLIKCKPWVRHATNPILEKSASGWDAYGLRDEMLLIDTSDNLVQESGNYIMYYRGMEYDPAFNESSDHIKRQIGRATSSDGISWIKDTVNNPVLELGTSGQWDAAMIGSAWVIKLGTNNYLMFYDGYNGTIWGVGRATSADGLNWTKDTVNNPILLPTDFAGLDASDVIAILSCIKTSGGIYALYFESAPTPNAIFGATSTDGINFTPLNSGQAVLVGSSGEWDSLQVANPKIVEIANGKYIMGYNGHNSSSQHKLGFAFSTDLTNWTKYSENPVMDSGASGEWDDYRVENALITKDDINENSIRMWYFGCPTSSGVTSCALGYAVCDQNAIKSGGDVDWTALWESGSEASYAIDTGRLKLKDSVIGWANAIYTQASFSSEKAIHLKVRFMAVGTLEAAYVGLSKDKPLTDWIFFFDTAYGLRYKNTSDASIVIWDAVAADKEYELIAIKKGTNLWHFELYEDGVEKVNEDRTDVTSESSKYFVFMRYLSADIAYIDNTLVRKHASPEPTWGTWGSEEEEKLGQLVLKLLQDKGLNIGLSQKLRGLNMALSQEGGTN